MSNRRDSGVVATVGVSGVAVMTGIAPLGAAVGLAPPTASCWVAPLDWSPCEASAALRF